VKPAAYALLGPTASGKSRLAMQLAGRLPIEIVSVDSAQVYRGLDIGTAKPSPAERKRVPHHLVDLLDPDEIYSAGRFRADAIAAVQDILARGRVPLLVGGTMLYYRTLVSGLDDLPQADRALREAIERQAAERGWPALHAELARVDPAAAARIGPNDARRIQRALEVSRLTGKPISAQQSGRAAELPFALRGFAIVPQDRAVLHRRIAERFDAMLEAGLVDEVKALKKRFKLNAELPSMRAAGYRQVWAHLEGEYGLAELRDKAIAATRQLAKRQVTWLRSFAGIEELGADDVERLARAMAR
jgi:tRNA dimethylallyltransferase